MTGEREDFLGLGDLLLIEVSGMSSTTILDFSGVFGAVLFFTDAFFSIAKLLETPNLLSGLGLLTFLVRGEAALSSRKFIYYSSTSEFLCFKILVSSLTFAC